MSSKTMVFSILAAALCFAVAPRAHATDGVVLINQATVQTGLPGCPNDGNSLVTICSPGSYRLSGNLSSSGKNAIDINADDVTLDLNGFTILGPFASGSAVYSNNNRITIENGSTYQFYNGIVLGGTGNVVERVTVSNARNAGILLSQQGEVRYCQLVNNFYAGVYYNGGGTAPGGQVSDSEILAGGGYYGVLVYGVSAVSVQHTFIQGASLTGLFYFTPTTGPYGQNTFLQNGTNVIDGVSLGNNLCSNALC